MIFSAKTFKVKIREREREIHKNPFTTFRRENEREKIVRATKRPRSLVYFYITIILLNKQGIVGLEKC